MPYIDNDDKGIALKATMERYAQVTDNLAEQLTAGTISLGTWEETMRAELKRFTRIAASVGAGSPEKLTRRQAGTIGAHLKGQYKWLHDFSQAIYEKRDTISLAAIRARARLYVHSLPKIATRLQAGTLKAQFPYLPGDGSTQCLNQCRCTWELSKVAEAENVASYSATWTLHPAEHCPDCVGRDGNTVTVTAPIGADVPSSIGLGTSL